MNLENNLKREFCKKLWKDLLFAAQDNKDFVITNHNLRYEYDSYRMEGSYIKNEFLIRALYNPECSGKYSIVEEKDDGDVLDVVVETPFGDIMFKGVRCFNTKKFPRLVEGNTSNVCDTHSVCCKLVEYLAS